MNKNMKIALVIGGIVVAVLILLPLVIGPTWGWRGGRWGMPWWCPMEGFGWGWGWGWFMPVFMILFGGLVIWGVVALVRGMSHPSSPTSSSNQPDSALEVLKRRYARGEISKEEYEEKRNDIT
jgi:putative membrane protein